MIKQDIQAAVTVAMKEKRETELKVLRFTLSQIQYEEINKQKELTDEEVVVLLRKEVKKRREAIEMFKKGKRNDLVTDEKAQITIIQRYTPKQMPEADVEKTIDEVLVDSEKSLANMGKIIGAVMAKVKGNADGATVSALVQRKLQKST